MRRSLVRGPCLAALALALAGCPAEPTPAGVDMRGGVDTPGGVDMPGGSAAVGRRPSKSGTIAIADDDSVVLLSNPDDGSVSTFDPQTGDRIARVRTGREPWAVVIHPDRTTAFVANRADATVVKLSGIGGAGPAVSAPVAVGSEPTGLALSPTGARLFVAEWGEGRVSVIDTATMRVVATIDDVRSPRAIAVTNNGDASDADELVVVPEFYGEPVSGGEGRDDGRRGRVRLYSAAEYEARGEILFQPLSAEEAGFGVGTAPNQLAALALSGQKVFVTSVSASPQGPPRFDNNVNPVIYVGDLAGKRELRGAAGTFNLARKINEAIPPGSGPRLFMADLRDVDFVPGSTIAYFVAEGADAVQRVQLDRDGAVVQVGSTQNRQIDVLGDARTGSCQAPIGIAIASGLQRAFLNCWVSRRMGVVDLNSQTLARTVASSDPPTGEAVAALRGKRFYFTGRGRWAQEAWSSCGSCHPDGLSDNITWVFGTGPRQTTSMDGSFSHGPGAQKQRIFNWTAVNDELHDFEGNTRGTSGGLGAITTAVAQGDCGDVSKEVRVGIDANGALPAGLAAPVRELQEGAGLPAGVRCVKDWDDVDAFVRTIRPPRGRRGLDPASVARGAQLFSEARGGCLKCHGGAGWTISRRHYTPSAETNASLATTVDFVKPPIWPASYTVHSTSQIAPQPARAELAGFNAAPIGPPQLACALRSVGTFGVIGDAAATDALEKKADGTRAQGRGGYNVPSLYGLQLGAPYLHNGQARTLEELFSHARFLAHTQAGSANFLGAGNVAPDRQDLINFLLSIDATTAEQAVPAGFADGCRQN